MEISVGESGKKIASFIGRNHFMIFFILVAIGLIVAVITLSNTLSSPNTEGYTSTITEPTLDESVITELEALDSTRTEMTLPSGRINPF